MSNDAYKLQGLDGVDQVLDGETFAVNTLGNGSESRGFQVDAAGTFTYKKRQFASTPAEKTYADKALEAGIWIGGPITSLAVSGGGEATVFPSGSGYTIS